MRLHSFVRGVETTSHIAIYREFSATHTQRSGPDAGRLIHKSNDWPISPSLGSRSRGPAGIHILNRIVIALTYPFLAISRVSLRFEKQALELKVRACLPK